MTIPQKSIYFSQFDGGMVSDPRNPGKNVCRTCQNFNNYTNPYKLTPYVDGVSGNTVQTTNPITNFQYVGTTLYGMGVNGGGGLQIYSQTSFSSATWSVFDDVGGSVMTDADMPFFTYYATTGKLYGVRGGTYIWSLLLSGPTGNTSAQALTYTTVSNGIVHSVDDILYFGYDNFIASNNNDSWNTTALTLPAQWQVTSICEYGNYLAIGCQPLNGTQSIVYLWDRVSTSWNVSIPWYEGNLSVLEVIEGYLVGVSFEGTTGSYTVNNRMIGRYYDNTLGAVLFQQLVGASQVPTGATGLYKAKGHNKIYFPASVPIGTTPYWGIWSVNRNSSGAPFAFVLNRLPIQPWVTDLALYGLIELGDYLFFSYATNSTFYMDKTNSTATYSTVSIFETTINPNMPEGDRPQLKKLLSAGCLYEALPSGAQVVLKYRVNGGSWVTVFTETTTGQVRTEPVPISGGDGAEFEFHVESTGGAEITGVVYKYELIPSNN